MNRKTQTGLSWALILLIMLVAGLLRVWNMGTVSMSNDELSALHRLDATSLTELWNKGVNVDGHPALVQTFLYYWLQLFPKKPWIIRLPFVIAGLLSVFWAYRIAKREQEEGVAWIIAATMAVLQYFIIYSQLARPYAMGLLFTLMLYDAWSCIVLNETDRPKWYKWMYYTLSAVLAMYTHYFSFLMVLILGLTGLFYLKKSIWKEYLLSGLCMIVLFLPHLHITLRQLSEGGVGGWLDKPDYDFFYQYLFYAFNRSWFLITFFLFVLLIGLLSKKIARSLLSRRLIWLLFWLTPMLVGFYYSRWRNPVLQYSVLIFSFPFFLFLLFSFISGIQRKWQVLIALVVLALGSYSTVIEKQFYKRTHWAEFKDLAYWITTWEQIYGHDIYQIAAANAPSYLGFYLDRTRVEPDEYIQDIPDDWTPFRERIKNLSQPYLSLSWSNQVTPIEWIEFIKESYPYVLHRRYYFNSETWLFSRNKPEQTVNEDILEKKYFNPAQGWQNDPVNDTAYYYVQDEYLATFEMPVEDLIQHPSNILYMHGDFHSTASSCHLHMAFSLQDNSGQTLHWEGRQSQLECGEDTICSFWHAMRFTFKSFRCTGATIKAYIWNPDACSVGIKNLTLELRSGNPVIYGAD
ncbi:MAG: glycosyltransferase family 39 protein [Flavobacteriales bacterium]|nr:glycosyltransferase family 39 protein [Flavobacteriales bacterium]